MSCCVVFALSSFQSFNYNWQASKDFCEDLVLSETCYNLAVCNRKVGYDLYNSVLETINSATDDIATLNQSLDDAKNAIIYLKVAKERFYDASSFNPDDKVSTSYAKELNKIIKQLKNLFIPALEEKL